MSSLPTRSFAYSRDLMALGNVRRLKKKMYQTRIVQLFRLAM